MAMSGGRHFLDIEVQSSVRFMVPNSPAMSISKRCVLSVFPNVGAYFRDGIHCGYFRLVSILCDVGQDVH